MANNYKDFYVTAPKPEAETNYTVPKGAWLDTISQATYGYDRVNDIIAANDYLQSRGIIRGTSKAELPTIHPGDILWLPAEEDIEDPDTIPADNENEVGIRIDGKIFRGWETSSITRSIDTCADSFTFVAPYDPFSENAKYLQPYTYSKADLFIGGELYILGMAMKHTPSGSESSSTMSVEVRSLPGVTIECNSTAKSLNYKNQTMKQIADDILIPFGIKTEFPDGDSDPFTKANRDITDNVFSFLSKLAVQKGFMITSSRNGKMSFVRAAIDSDLVASFYQGEQPIINIDASYDSTQRFSSIIAVSQSSGKTNNKSEVLDTSISNYRPLIFTADETEAGNITNAAKWKRSRMLAASAPVSATVSGWRDFNGNLWMENTLVTVYFPKRCIFEETEFLITGVSLTKDSGSGNIATLTLALPQAYTLEFPEVFPWTK